MKTVTPAVAPTEKQLSFLFSLMDEWASLKERTGHPVDAAATAERKEHYSNHASRSEVSKAIDATMAANKVLKAVLPAAPKTDPSADYPSIEEVPAGRYAIDTQDGAANELAFYKVDRPTEGRWAGYVFVKLQVSDDEQRVSREVAKSVVRRIAEVGAQAASARYGHELGVCGVCGRTLTNDESRALGIGPVCRDKVF